MLFTCIASTPLSASLAYGAETIKIGVLAFRPKPQTLAQWQPLAVALKLAIPDHDFEVEALTFLELEQAVSKHQVDFVLTNPGHYVLLSRLSGLSAPLATLAANDHGRPVAVFGGVIFSRAEQANINTLTDIKGKTIAITGTESLGGYQTEAYELKKIGVNLPQDAQLIVTEMPHDNVVETVLAGRADVGFVRSGVLEGMIHEGRLDWSQLKILNLQPVSDFPMQVSTPLYPEWPISSLSHIDENLARHVAAALFMIEENTAATRAMDIHGFVVPANYNSVIDLLRALRLPPFDYTPSFTLQDILHNYFGKIVASLLVMGLILILAVRLLLTKRNLEVVYHGMLLQKQLLQASEQKYSTILESVDACIYLKDRLGNYLFGNRSLCDFFGISMEQIIGQSDDNFFDVETAVKLRNIDRKVFKNREILKTEETIFNARSGCNVTFLTVKIPLTNEAGEVYALCGISTDITERKKFEIELLEKEERLSLATVHNNIGVWDWNLITQELIWDDSMFALYHVDRNDFRGTGEAWRASLHPDDLGYGDQEVNDALSGDKQFNMEFRIVWPNDEIRNIKAVAKVFRDEQGTPLRMLGINVDITERKRAEAELRIAATAFESQEGIMITDATNNILRVNSAFTHITGYTSAEVVGKNPRMLQSKQHDENFYSVMWECINNTGGWQGEIWNQRKNGEIFPEQMSITAVKDQNNIISNYVATLNDITLRKEAVEKIERLAFYDPLTGLPNRRLLQDRLKPALASSHRNGRQGALLFIDMDNFKTLNDTLGHDMGDLLLQQIAQRLESCVREGDTVARLGGDEFVVMLEDLSDKALEAATQTEVIGNKILAILNQNYQLATHDYHSTPSIGATLFIGQDQSVEELLKQADIAMYQAKASGRNALRFFDPQMQVSITARVALEEDLRLALVEDQFILYYQPQVSHNYQIIGAEVLIRWQHPVRGLVSPVDFIPMAEESNLILAIGQWVLKTACVQIKIWESSIQTQHLQLAVNVSSRQFYQEDFVEQVAQILSQIAINPNKLKLELTESLVLDDIEDTICKMNLLRNLGIRFSMDDFGTGYSSLSSLKKLPLDQLKIDQSFVRDISINQDNTTIVETIIAMANKLNMEVIAEGVETEAQRSFLELHDCQLYQGYLFSKPVPLEQFEALLNQGLLRPSGME